MAAAMMLDLITKRTSIALVGHGHCSAGIEKPVVNICSGGGSRTTPLVNLAICVTWIRVLLYGESSVWELMMFPNVVMVGDDRTTYYM